MLTYVTRLRERSEVPESFDFKIHAGDNSGNLLFYGALRRIFNFDRIVYPTDLTEEVLRKTSHFITSDLTWILSGEDLPPHCFRVLDKIPKSTPLIPISVGLQSDSSGDFQFHPNVKKYLKELGNRCCVGCREDFTAEKLWQIGLRNLKVIGCPSLHYNLDCNFQINSFGELPGKITTNATLYPHCEQEKLLFRSFLDYCMKNGYEYVEQTKFDCLSLLCAEKDETERETYRRFTDRIFFDLENWFNYIKASDFSFGGRFHGNVVSLILGRPALFFSLDNRISGMCDYFKLPYMDFRRFDPRITLDELYERADFTKFNLSYKAKYIDFCDFCESNGISGDMLQMVYPKPIQQPDKQAFLSMNDSVPTLSVIVPAYGTEMYLEKCLRSLMTQSLDSIEIIVVNDGSFRKCRRDNSSFARRRSAGNICLSRS